MRVDDLPLVDSIAGWHRALPVLSEQFLYDSAAAGTLSVLRVGRKIVVSRSAILGLVGEPTGEARDGA